MAIELPKETKDRPAASINRHFEEALEQETGDLKAPLLLGFVLEEIGLSVYNLTVADDQTRMAEVVGEAFDVISFDRVAIETAGPHFRSQSLILGRKGGKERER